MLQQPDVDALTAWAAAFGKAEAGVIRISLDIASSFSKGSKAFPFDAMLSLWLAPGAAPPDDTVLAELNPALTLLTDVCETTPQELAARYKPRLA